MRTIKINKNKPIYREKEFEVKSMKRFNNLLLITVDKNNNINVGDIIHFTRKVLVEHADELRVIRKIDMRVIDIDNGVGDDIILKVEYPEREPLVALSAMTVGKETRVIFNRPINVFAHDLCSLIEDELKNVNIKLYNNTVSGMVSDLKISERPSIYHNFESGVTPADFIVKQSYYEDYLCRDDADFSGFTKSPELYYLPVRQRDNEIYGKLSGALSANSLSGATAIISQNEFFYCDAYDDCYFWDTKTEKYFQNPHEELEYPNDNERNVVTATRNIGYWTVPIGLTVDEDSVHLNQEQFVNDYFVNDIKNRAMASADVIDMERVKYTPVRENAKRKNEELSSLTFNFHFRKRKEENWSYDGDGWNGGEGITKLLNLPSDLLSDLNFVDNDVRYQKMKVKKSFIRLSFYNSNDPLTQSLLYYSTIFLDGGELYGKFMRTRTELLENGIGWEETADSKFVIEESSSKYRIDSQISVSDETNNLRCSEGFYLYLFADDAEMVDDENGWRTIYMKVEFNHAGYGRTIPMVMWPFKGGIAQSLTIDNYLNALYIPIKISHINDKFYYKFDVEDNPCCSIPTDETAIIFNLFEPKLEEE